jgi:hypothetical protein
MEQIPPWETNRFSASKEIPRILWKPNFITAFTRACVNIDMFLRREVFSTSPKFQAGAPSRVGCPLLLIQYIRS